jgi:hypothetical protein
MQKPKNHAQNLIVKFSESLSLFWGYFQFGTAQHQFVSRCLIMNPNKQNATIYITSCIYSHGSTDKYHVYMLGLPGLVSRFESQTSRSRRAMCGSLKPKRIRIHIHNQFDMFHFFVALRPNAGHGFLIFKVSRSHTTTHHSR